MLLLFHVHNNSQLFTIRSFSQTCFKSFAKKQHNRVPHTKAPPKSQPKIVWRYHPNMVHSASLVLVRHARTQLKPAITLNYLLSIHQSNRGRKGARANAEKQKSPPPMHQTHAPRQTNQLHRAPFLRARHLPTQLEPVRALDCVLRVQGSGWGPQSQDFVQILPKSGFSLFAGYDAANPRVSYHRQDHKFAPAPPWCFRT